jgi:hypothetical protein
VSDAVIVRFIVPVKGSRPENDTLRFELGPPGKSKLLQKYLVANLFLRLAASATASDRLFDFVGRSEDDALVDAAATAAHLGSLRSLVVGPILYGVKGEWVMWAPTTMTPVCWGMTLRRWEVQRRRDAAALSAALAHGATNLSQWEPSGECHTGNIGPSMLIKGPLVVYSHELLGALVSSADFGADEALVRSSWDRIRAARLAIERRLRPAAPRMGVVYAPFAEDVYYAMLVHRVMGNRSLSFFSVPMAEYAWNTPPSREAKLGRLPSAAVYHRLSPSRLNSSGLSDGVHLRSWWRKRMRPVAAAVARCQSMPAAAKRAAESLPCCANWRVCNT